MSFKGLLAAILICCMPVSIFSVTFDASKKLSKISEPQISGTCLPVWNYPETYSEIKKAFALSHYATIRFPDGSVSNEYHWNGKGALDSSGIWHPDTVASSDGFQCTNRFCGTSSSNYGTERYSYATDGDTNTFWWSDSLITESDPYIYLYWPSSRDIDSVVILWGKKQSKRFEVQAWKGNMVYPGPYQMSSNEWNTVFTDSSGAGGCSRISFPQVKTLALRIISHSALSGNDIQIREIYAFSKGIQVSTNSPDYDTQTKTVALSTHPGMKKTNVYPWTFDNFMDYLDTLGYPAIPVICANYGTGTPEEAAAWVYYANKVKKHNIKYWQIGNEMDGAWEIGGPVNAYMYAEKFIKFSKAMKAVDPGIKILGGLVSQPWKLSGEYDGKTWLESVIYKIGEKEKSDKCKYIDGVDFHSYPYVDMFDFSTYPPTLSSNINPQKMALASDYIYDQSDSILTWINRYLENPDSVMVMMSEYNSCVVMSSLMNKPVNAMAVANMNAGLVQKLGYRAMSVVWEVYEDGSVGPDSTYGALTLFNTVPKPIVASIEPSPSAIFWGNFMVSNIWLDPHKDNNLIVSDSCRAGNLRYFGNATSDDARVLVLNLSATDTLNVNVNMTGASYSNVSVYSWGEREFTWHGTNAKAYAMPNCGPSSRTTTVNDLGTPKIGPMCAMVLRYFNSDTGSSSPERIFLTSVNSMSKPGDTIGVSVSYRVTKGTITSVAYKIDTAPFTNAPALDNSFDGPYENCFLKFDSRTLGAGNFKLIIRAQSSTGDTCMDTVNFRGYLPVMQSKVKNQIDIPLTITRQSDRNLRIRYLPEGKGIAYIKIYSLSGELVKEFTSNKTGAPMNIVWDGSTGKDGRVSPGFLLVKAGVKGMKTESSRMISLVK